MMLGWKRYLQQLQSWIGEMARLSPDTVRGYQTLTAAGENTRFLDAKTRELIALACSVTARSDGAITLHAKAAANHGATREEVAEALGVCRGALAPGQRWCSRCGRSRRSMPTWDGQCAGNQPGGKT